MRIIAAGLFFAVLWGSASTATKIALADAQPFTISIIRFLIAAVIMLFTAHVIFKEKIPSKEHYPGLIIYGLLNISVYLGLFIISMQFLTAGIASLFIATSPVFISIMAALWLKQKVRSLTVISLIICSAGIMVAAYPLLHSSSVTVTGLIIILGSMLCYSIASLYFSNRNWKEMNIITINGWQTFFGAIFTLPFFLLFFKREENHFTFSLMGSILWLAIPVSMGAVQLWMYLLRENPVKASFWLFLCPVFGIIIAALILKENINLFTIGGLCLVLLGLFLVQRSNPSSE